MTQMYEFILILFVTTYVIHISKKDPKFEFSYHETFPLTSLEAHIQILYRMGQRTKRNEIHSCLRIG